MKMMGLIIGLLLTCLLTASASENLQRYEFRKKQMGVVAQIVLYAPSKPIAENAANLAFERIEQLESLLSSFRKHSEINRLCEHPHQWVPVSRDLLKILKTSQTVSHFAAGRFDVTAGPLIALWKKTKNSGRLPAARALEQARQLVDYKSIVLDEKALKVKLLKEAMQIDFGGIGKGYAADEAIAVLRRCGIQSALVALSGDIVVADPPPGRPGWNVGIGRGYKKDSYLSLYLKNKAISTSGDLEQSVDIESVRYSHIVDPRTGLGATHSNITTVIAANGTTADSLATAASLMTVSEVEALLQPFEGSAALILLRKDKHLVQSYRTKGFPLLHEPTRVSENKVQDTGTPFLPYRETIPGSGVSFDMLPIPSGTFRMGSEPSESGHQADEAPTHSVTIAPFWMGKHEVTWNEYELYYLPNAQGLGYRFDAITKPTQPYLDPTFGLGREGHPVISITHHAAMEYCKWLSEVTGRQYRLPSEAEWEYAARAGTSTPYSFGPNSLQLRDYTWYTENSDGKPHPVGKKLPNPWGLFDMHGNVMEWVLDTYQADFYRHSPSTSPVRQPVDVASVEHSFVARGGSWVDLAKDTRSASRVFSTVQWSALDPQMPKSVWWHTDAQFVGFRVVRPLEQVQ